MSMNFGFTKNKVIGSIISAIVLTVIFAWFTSSLATSMLDRIISFQGILFFLGFFVVVYVISSIFQRKQF